MEEEQMVSKLTKALLVLALVATFLPANEAFTWQRIDLSPEARVMQRIKTTDITVVYHRPSVTPPDSSDRTSSVIWGDVEPYGQIWRAGANEATTMEFSADVTIQGQELAAGLYSFWILLERNEWTLVFNSDPNVWGTQYPGESKDVLRVKSTPETVDHLERLAYFFEEVDSESTVLYLHWDKLRVPINIRIK